MESKNDVMLSYQTKSNIFHRIREKFSIKWSLRAIETNAACNFQLTGVVLDDNAGGAVEVGVDVHVASLHVPLNQQLILLSIPTACKDIAKEDM